MNIGVPISHYLYVSLNLNMDNERGEGGQNTSLHKDYIIMLYYVTHFTIIITVNCDHEIIAHMTLFCPCNLSYYKVIKRHIQKILFLQLLSHWLGCDIVDHMNEFRHIPTKLSFLGTQDILVAAFVSLL